MEHGHVQVSGASVSLEAVVSVVSSRAMSNQDIVPGNAGTPPTPPIKEDMRGCSGGWGVCTRMWNGAGGIPGVRCRGQGQQQMAKMGPGDAPPLAARPQHEEAPLVT